MHSADAPPLISIAQLPLGPIGTNCYIVHEPGSSDCVVVDPGADADQIQAYVAEHSLIVNAIFVTHCHWDHVGAVADLHDATNAPVYVSTIEADTLAQPGTLWETFADELRPHTAEHLLDGGERLMIAGLTFDVVHTPGHSPGSLTFVMEGVLADHGDGYDMPPIALSGDVLFAGSVGRTDIPHASGDELFQTLEKLRSRLHPETVILSGHGEVTTFEHELAHNPFLRR